jgi:N utilization substance protein B
MKKKSDPRHLVRRRVVQSLFAWDLSEQKGGAEKFVKITENEHLFKETVKNISSIDAIIQRAAPAWPIGQISRVDLAILRLAIFELRFRKDIPPKVVIDEAVELAKEFGGETSPSFVNGVLGTVLKEVKMTND